MRVKSAYISKKEANQEFDASTAPNATSETNLDMTSNRSIAENASKSNTFSKNSSKENSGKRFALPEGVEIETVDDIIAGISQGGHEFNGYRAFINRDTGGIGATVTVKRPDGERIRQRIDNGRYLKDSELWEYAAAW